MLKNQVLSLLKLKMVLHYYYENIFKQEMQREIAGYLYSLNEIKIIFLKVIDCNGVC